MTEKDIADLPFVAANADLVGFSFVGDPATCRSGTVIAWRSFGPRLGDRAQDRDAAGLRAPAGAAAGRDAQPRVGVMIARGDLAVEIGYERLAEVQEEILWICEAAHLPVIWATQVLETLAKSGLPSRAEITDAAMGERAECVMLNKGPHIVERSTCSTTSCAGWRSTSTRSGRCCASCTPGGRNWRRNRTTRRSLEDVVVAT